VAGDLPVERAFRGEWAGVLAHVARRFGDLGLAEDATQDAFVAAAERWPRDGVPANPGAWLEATARRKAVDRLRRERRLERSAEALGAEEALLRAGEDPDDPPPGGGPSAEVPPGTRAAVPDDRLRLVFCCCHPALALEARVALTLRLVAGLTTAEIARAFLVGEPAMAQRLSRAKAKIRRAGMPFAVPGPAELPGRLHGVLAVVYLVFTEGHTVSGGDRLVREELCGETVRLARLLRALVPGAPETGGLLALCLLHHARRAARADHAGRPVPLAEQERLRWDGEEIAEGVGVLEQALRAGRPGPYQVQAAIAALHAQAPTSEETDWAQVAALYADLARRAPSPVVEVNRAVAVGMADGPHAGLAVLEPLLGAGLLEGYAPLHAAHADLLERAGDPSGAAAAWRRAAASTGNAGHREELARRAAGPRAR